MLENEILNPLSILGDDGYPMNFGWSRQPEFFYDPAMAAAPRHRITESDRYIVHSPTHIVVFEIKDDGWLGSMGISVISLRDKKRSTQTFKTIIPMGAYELPPSSVTGSVRWRSKKTHLDFICMKGGARIIKTEVPKFGSRRSLRSELVLSEPGGAQSLIINQSWQNEKYAFKYTRCSPWFTVEGVVQFGSSEIIFTKGNAWGILDWRRCCRPKTDIQYWATACGISNGRLLGFCVGQSLADSSKGSENAFFVDGKLHKLDKVTFHIPLSNWLSPWRFSDNDNRLEMTFTPHQERIERQSFLFYKAARRQVYGLKPIPT